MRSSGRLFSSGTTTRRGAARSISRSSRASRRLVPHRAPSPRRSGVATAAGRPTIPSHSHPRPPQDRGAVRQREGGVVQTTMAAETGCVGEQLGRAGADSGSNRTTSRPAASRATRGRSGCRNLPMASQAAAAGASPIPALTSREGGISAAGGSNSRTSRTDVPARSRGRGQGQEGQIPQPGKPGGGESADPLES